MTPRPKRPEGTAVPVRKTARRWQVPPPLTNGPEALEAGAVLLEVRNENGGLLWQVLRDVLLWAAAPTDSWTEIFAPYAYARRAGMVYGSGVDEELAEPLLRLSSVLKSGQVDPRLVVESCLHVSKWAEHRGLWATALAYSQAVAIILPRDAAAALSVGVLARRTGEHARAESWLRRAVMLARQTGDWVSYTIAFLRLGNLFMQRGNFPIARKLLTRAQRAARRHGHIELEGHALHDLCGIAITGGDAVEAEALAAAAMDAYGLRNPRLPALAHDLAYLWLEQGRFGRALAVFEAVLPHLDNPADRVHVFANIARAAAGAGRRERFEWAWAETLGMLEHAQAVEDAAQALVDAALGAALLREWERAGGAARQALQLATERNESKVRLTAEAILDSVNRRRLIRPETAVGSVYGSGEELATEFLERLSAKQVTSV